MQQSKKCNECPKIEDCDLSTAPTQACPRCKSTGKTCIYEGRELDKSWKDELASCGCSETVLANFKTEEFFTKASAMEITDEQLSQLGVKMAVCNKIRRLLNAMSGPDSKPPSGLSATPAAAAPVATEGTPRKRRQSAGFKQTPMKKASSEGILQYQIIAPKNHEELQEQLGIIILDEAAIGDATQKLPKSLQALLQKLVQSSTMSLSELAATFKCTEAQVTAMKQNLMNRLDKIRQSEKDGKPRKERVYHTAFDLFVELIMEQHFAVDFDSSLAYKGSPGQKRSKVLIPDAGIGLRLGPEFAIVRTRLQELLGHRLVDTLVLPWFLFEYKQAATSEEGLYVSSEKLACELLLIEQNMEVLLHGLGVQAEDDLGDLRLPFAIAAHLGPGGCRFMALSPDENERGYRPCIRLARIPWTDSDRILTCFVHIVECGKRFWSTIKAAVDLNRPRALPPSFTHTLDALPYEEVRVGSALDDTADSDSENKLVT